MLLITGCASTHLPETIFWEINFAFCVIVVSVRPCDTEWILSDAPEYSNHQDKLSFIMFPVNKAETTVILQPLCICGHVTLPTCVNISVPELQCCQSGRWFKLMQFQSAKASSYPGLTCE